MDGVGYARGGDTREAGPLALRRGNGQGSEEEDEDRSTSDVAVTVGEAACSPGSGSFVLRERGSATRHIVEKVLAASGVRPQVAMELGSNAAVAGAVAASTGIGIVPTRTLATQFALKQLNVSGLKFLRPFVLVIERGRPLSPAAEAFVAICGGKENP
jgi:DNA-binding transcriptional LysR family regulator